MRLSVYERGLLLNILPQKSTFENIVTISDLKMELGVTSVELEQIDFEIKFICADCKKEHYVKIGDTVDICDCGGSLKPTGNRRWNLAKDPYKDIKFNNVARNIITDVLNKMNKEGNIESKFISLYKKFIIGEEDYGVPESV